MLLGDAIRKSLAAREPIPDFEQALLRNKSTIRLRQEGDLWDYKERFNLNDAHNRALVAKHILAFHNAHGGCLIVGVNNEYQAVGISNERIDNVRLKQAVQQYLGTTISFFVSEILLANNRTLVVIFIPQRSGSPVPAQANGPDSKKSNKPVFRKGDYFVRVDDESRLVQDPNDFCRLFNGFSPTDALAYSFDVDKPMFRLLRPHCTKFIGRTGILNKLADAMRRDRPIFSLDGPGGVGKSELAIAFFKSAYDRCEYDFIVSMSAKHSIWVEHQTARQPGFSGFHEFLNALREVLLPEVNPYAPSNELATDLLNLISAGRGLILVDNAESISDPAIIDFLTNIPNPTKVLVTSRTDRQLGAFPMTLPAMDANEARELLEWELERCGIEGREDEMTDALAVAEGLPLAIKWTAQLADRYGSLSAALKAFKKESSSFLSFCFHTMFDTLNPLASRIALSYAYLGEDSWTVPILAIAHECTEDQVKDAMFEMQDRGLLPPGSLISGAQVVPVLQFATYIQQKWGSENRLKKKIEVALGSALGNHASHGIFVTLEPQLRAAALLASGMEHIEKKQFSFAIKCLKAASIENVDNPHISFQLGVAQWRDGKKAGGLFNMEEAYKKMKMPNINDTLLLAEAFLDSLEPKCQSIGLRYLADAFVKSPSDFSVQQSKTFASKVLELRQYDTLKFVLAQTKLDEWQYEVRKTLAKELAILGNDESARSVCESRLNELLNIR